MSVRRTSEVPIPDDLRAFLAARKQLAYEPQLLSEVGVVKLKPLRALRLQKIWVVAPAGTERHDPNRKREGFYVVLDLDLDPQSTLELERNLKLANQVMRHLLIRNDEQH